jgi:hypothetical protein
MRIAPYFFLLHLLSLYCLPDLPFDVAGNIRVLRVYWKSRRRIKKIKRYDPQTGEEIFNFYPETYVVDKDAGEEEQIFYINEAWEGTKIGTFPPLLPLHL